MILVIPALQMIDGHCSLFIKGEVGTESLYARLSDRPTELCSLWRTENAKTIHITDYDSNQSTEYSNLDSIIYMAEMFDIPFQVLANFRSQKECEYLLDNGIYRISFGEFAMSNPNETKELIKKYSPSKIIGFVDSREGKVQTSQYENVMAVDELLTYYKDLGFQRIIYREADWLRYGSGIDFTHIIEIAKNYKFRITLFEGITNSKDLLKLNNLSKYGIDSIVMGQALYENNFPCQKIWRLIESELDK